MRKFNKNSIKINLPKQSLEHTLQLEGEKKNKEVNMSQYAAIACNRFGLGAAPGEIESVASDPKAWLSKQLDSTLSDTFPSSGLSTTADTLYEFMMLNRERRALKKSGADITDITKKRRNFLRSTQKTETDRRLNFSVETQSPFYERLTRFWTNHFSVSAKNGQMRLIVGAYEREAIRPNIMGSFANLAEQAIFHPAMLMYLDNQGSIGPNSKVGLRRAKGLNENLAREVMELHTITTNAHYSQEDVTEFARALTGWTIRRNWKRPDLFGRSAFGKNRHEPGIRYVLGQPYDEAGGDQAKNILLDFCSNENTAHNVAYKLAKHFLADSPPATLVDKLKAAFLDTGGNLKAVYEVLIDAYEMWESAPQKVKTPQELITSTARLIGLDAAMTNRPNAVLRSFAQTQFGAPTPEGWSDDAADWIGADALTKRIEWANRVGKRNADLDALDLIQQALGETLGDDSRESIARAESASDALALALLCPEFQRR